MPKQKNSAAKQNCCLSCFFSLKKEAGRNIKINPLPPQILPLSRSIKNILELGPCLCSSALEEDFCQDTDPLWILQMSLSLFSSSKGEGRKKNTHTQKTQTLSNLCLVLCQAEPSEDLFLNGGCGVIYGITAEPHCVLVTNCTDIPWDVSSNEHGIYYTAGKRGAQNQLADCNNYSHFSLKRR